MLLFIIYPCTQEEEEEEAIIGPISNPIIVPITEPIIEPKTPCSSPYFVTAIYTQKNTKITCYLY